MLKESGVGIPGLLVVFYDVDPQTRYTSDQPYLHYGCGHDRSKRIAVLIYTTHGRGIWLG